MNALYELHRFLSTQDPTCVSLSWSFDQDPTTRCWTCQGCIRIWTLPRFETFTSCYIRDSKQQGKHAMAPRLLVFLGSSRLLWEAKHPECKVKRHRQQVDEWCNRMGWVLPEYKMNHSQMISTLELYHPLLSETRITPLTQSLVECKETLARRALPDLQKAVYPSWTTTHQDVVLRLELGRLQVFHISWSVGQTYKQHQDTLNRWMEAVTVVSRDQKHGDVPVVSFDTEWDLVPNRPNHLALLAFCSGRHVLLIHLPQMWFRRPRPRLKVRHLLDHLIQVCRAHGITQWFAVDSAAEERAIRFVSPSSISIVDIGTMVHDRFPILSRKAGLVRYSTWFLNWDVKPYAIDYSSPRNLGSWFSEPLSPNFRCHVVVDVLAGYHLARTLSRIVKKS